MLLLLPATLRAYDFSATVPSGQTLYFNYVTGGVEVTHPVDAPSFGGAWGTYAKPSGAMTIPATVSDGTDTYAVLSVGSAAFYNCGDLTAVTLASGIVQVADYAFSYCAGVETLTLSATLTSIGNQSFANMGSLAHVWAYPSTPPATTDYTFNNTPITACTLHVGCFALAAYSAVTPWSTFGTVQNEGCNVTVAAMANHTERGSVTGGGTYAAGTLVTLVAQPAAGFCFVCWHDGDTLNPRLVDAATDTAFTAMFFALQRDTVYLADGDTVTLHDTIHLTDTVYYAVAVHDTTVVHDTVTLTLAVHDTVTLRDTIVPTYFTLAVQSDNGALGVGVGSGAMPAGTVVEVCGLPLEGGRFTGWSDGVADNPRHVTLTGNLTLYAQFEPLAVGTVAAEPWSTVVEGRRLTVRCDTGRRLRIYDATGRTLLSATTRTEHTALLLPAAGVYLVQVADGAARRIVIEQ